MRMTLISVLLTAALLPAGISARAEMVVDRNSGEHVDFPYARHYVPSVYYHRHSRRYARSVSRHILTVRSGFPTPGPFGWFECCL